MTSDACVYQALDLSAVCNAGVERLEPDQQPRPGVQQCHGLPFRIAEGSQVFVAFGPELNENPVTIRFAAARGVTDMQRLVDRQR